MWFPRRRVVLADPGLGVAQLIEPAQRLEVPVVACLQSPLRRMGRHGEIAEFHGGSSVRAQCRLHPSSSRLPTASTATILAPYCLQDDAYGCDTLDQECARRT